MSTLPDSALAELYEAEIDINKRLIDATDLYRSNREPMQDAAGLAGAAGGGFLPGSALSAPIPTLIVNETISERERSVHAARGK
ncbi:hypothetical protein [Achromobacter sp. UBA2119]|uniref:hypothetical protein n=1 Tax=Achromobacter sp. UBA2119 TaxID=1945911 RepID=UPI00257A3ED3|nr:hypothetical protein [Achromobacter sp. UBA2119]